MPATRLLIVAGAVVAAVTLFVVLRPGEDEAAPPAEPAPPAETARAETEEEPTPPTETEPSPEPEPEVETLVVTVRGGVPESGVVRVVIERDAVLRIVVRSDAPDHVHLHGYDIMRDVAPGAPAQIQFQATVPGVFELELEGRHVPIAEIEVRP